MNPQPLSPFDEAILAAYRQGSAQIVGKALENLVAGPAEQILVNHRLANGMRRLRICRWGDPVALAPYVLQCEHDGFQVLTWKDDDMPMYFAYIYWSVPNEPN